MLLIYIRNVKQHTPSNILHVCLALKITTTRKKINTGVGPIQGNQANQAHQAFEKPWARTQVTFQRNLRIRPDTSSRSANVKGQPGFMNAPHWTRKAPKGREHGGLLQPWGSLVASSRLLGSHQGVIQFARGSHFFTDAFSRARLTTADMPALIRITTGLLHHLGDAVEVGSIQPRWEWR